MNKIKIVSILRGLVVTVLFAMVITFLARFLFPTISDPVNEKEQAVSNIFGVLLIALSITIGTFDGIRFYKKTKNKK
jgi:uncharacterized membrane protein YagU involved in acid resistance